MRAPVLCLASLLVFTLIACGGDAATDESDTVSDAQTTTQTDAQTEGDGVSGPVGDWCVTSEQCAEEGDICTTQYGDCQACQGELEICCGVCEPSPCQDKACGETCDCPPGIECTEEPKACNASGQCVAAVLDLGCEESVPYDACDGLSCGDGCNPCPPGDDACASRPGLPHHCDDTGLCSNNEVETLGCTETCVGSNACDDGEVCTTVYGECITCAGDAGADPVCCGVCAPDPCANKACGDPCTCPAGVTCTAEEKACLPDGTCGTASGDLGCEGPDPYDPCEGLSCGANCNPCASDDQACQEMPMLEHWCDAEGQCTDGVDNEPPVCEASCLASSECGTEEVCTTEFGDCIACPGSESEPVCCGTCAPNPCAGKVCSDVCTCPDGIGCPEVPMACNSEGHCVSEPDGFECIGPFCEGKECGTPCGPAHVCDPTGACILNGNTPVTELCAVEAGDCTSSADCENGEACTTLYDACLPCADAPMLAVCCGTCEPYDPCLDKVCGAACGSCPPDQPDCVSIAVEQWCNNAGECSSEQSACDM